MRIYVESTIPSYIAARPARDILQAARQRLTRDWWEFARVNHSLFTSQVVLDEISAGDAEIARKRLRLMAGIESLDLTVEAMSLGKTIIASTLLPATADRDAAHIALATVHEMDILLSWNCRHIANAIIQTPMRRLVESAGFVLPVLCTPEELSGELYDRSE